LKLEKRIFGHKLLKRTLENILEGLMPGTWGMGTFSVRHIFLIKNGNQLWVKAHNQAPMTIEKWKKLVFLRRCRAV